MNHCQILMIDDDPDDLEILSTCFEQLGAEDFLAVSSANAAYDYLNSVEDNENLPKLVVTDLSMPDISGFDLLEALKNNKRYKHIPVIVYSTSSLQADIQKSITLGATGFYTKPSAMADYMGMTKRLMQHYGVQNS